MTTAPTNREASQSFFDCLKDTVKANECGLFNDLGRLAVTMNGARTGPFAAWSTKGNRNKPYNIKDGRSWGGETYLVSLEFENKSGSYSRYTLDNTSKLWRVVFWNEYRGKREHNITVDLTTSELSSHKEEIIAQIIKVWLTEVATDKAITAAIDKLAQSLTPS